MNPPRFDRFSQPQYLQHIGRERVARILLPFAGELLPHGIALPATTLPDDLFFQMLATLPRQVDRVSAKLLEAMVAIEVLDEVYPDERTPLVVTELRLRLGARQRPILLSAEPRPGTGPSGSALDNAAGAADSEPCFLVMAETSAGGPVTDPSNIQHSTPDIEPEESEPVDTDVARAAFALLQRLELDAPLKAPSVLTVFRLYCVDGYSAERVARKCRCAKGTVMSRLRFIEQATKTRPADFRAMSGHLQQMDDDLNASGAREIYRRGLAQETDG